MSSSLRGVTRSTTLLWSGLTLALAGALGYAAATTPGLFEIEVELGPGLILGTIAAAAGSLALVGSPRLALVVLVLFVYLNLSEVLVRFHDMPSLLQLLIVPVGASGLLAARARGVERLVLHPLPWLAGAYVLLLLLSTSWAWDPGLAGTEAVETGKGLILFLLVILLATTRDRLRLAVGALVGGGFVLGALSLVQVIRGDFSWTLGGLARIKQAQIYGDVFEPRIAGPLGDPNYYAQILLMVVPLALILAWRERRGWIRVGALTAAVVVVGAMLLTYSRGAVVALIAVLGMTVLVRGLSRREVLLGSAALVVLLVLAPSGLWERVGTLREMLPGQSREVVDPDSSFAKRRLVTLAAWEMFLDHPGLGVGAGNYPARFGPYGARVGSAAPLYDEPGEPQYPHNLYLEVAAESGAVGSILFGAALLVAFGSLARARTRFREEGDDFMADLGTGVAIALTGYLITSLFLHGHFQRYLWVLLALAAAWDVTASRGDSEGGGALSGGESVETSR